MLYEKSGLLGVSGISADSRELLASDRPEAREAMDLFAFRIAGETARLATSLGGLDSLVFTAGIGEHQPETLALSPEQPAWSVGRTRFPGERRQRACHQQRPQPGRRARAAHRRRADHRQRGGVHPPSGGGENMKPIIDLAGKRGLVVGIANEHSIATGCATVFRAAGAQLAITYLNSKAEPFVRPVAQALRAVHRFAL